MACRLLMLLALALSLGLSHPAEATPLYSAQTGVLSNSDSESVSGPTPVSASAGDLQTFTIGGGDHQGFITWAGESSAAAGPGYLRGSSHTLLNITDHQCCLASAAKAGGARSVMFIDDVYITGSGGSVAGILNIDLSGSLDAQANFANAIGSSGSYAQLSISVALPGGGGTGGARLGAGAPPQDTLTLTNSGLLSGYGGGIFHLAIASDALPVNTAFAITLILETETLASYSVGGTGPADVPILAEALSNFQDTLSFALNGPVFTLPDGYDVNSAGGAIVNNRYVGLSQIPEPASLAVLCSGIVLLTCMRRRRARRG